MNTSKYRMLVDSLKTDILGGKFDAGKPIPSIRALVAKFDVSKNTVLRAIDELVSQGLISRRQGCGTFVTRRGAARKIGLIVPGTVHSEYFSRIANEISRVALKEGYILLWGNLSSSNAETMARRAKKFAYELVRENVAGVLYQPLEFFAEADRFNREIVSVFDAADIPVVLLDYDIEPPPGRSKYDIVGVNNTDAGYRMCCHLIEAGAERICFVLRPNTSPSWYNRMRGVVTATNLRGGG